MPRSVPDYPKQWERPQPDAGRGYDIELITPMAGGGAKIGEVDSDFPVRPTAIRGHLRYWWRLVRGQSLGVGMWRREEEIFGSTEFPSPVAVYLDSCSKPTIFDVKTIGRFGPEAYALFASIENNHQVTGPGLKFRVVVQTANADELNRRRGVQNRKRAQIRQPLLPPKIAAIDDDVNAAMTAWIKFGGLGGRTRRGCGAVHCRNVGDAVLDVPGRIFVARSEATAMEAWKKSVDTYRTFRQTPRGERHSKTLRNGKTANVPGRSHWPEADSIRQITGCSLQPPRGAPHSGVPNDENTHDHSTPVVPANLLPAFPKAVLGLPINFHFADGPNKKRAAANLDPKDVQLYPLLPTDNGQLKKAERMVSPIITRPLWVNGNWRPAIIILDQSLPSAMSFRVEGANALVSGNLVRDLPLSHVNDVSLGAISPMRGKASAIDALIDFLGTRDFERLTR